MSYLEGLLASTRGRVAELRSKVTDEALEQRIASVDRPLDFAGALSGPQVALIAEIKRASPSKGPLALDLEAAKIAREVVGAGAAALSVLTEPEEFKGSMEDLEAAQTAGAPVLRKDFIIDPLQVLESRAAGADAVLLIVRILEDSLPDLLRLTRSLGMAALVEVFDESDVERAVDAGASIVGINHRDLQTFEVDKDRTAKLAPMLPDGTIVVGLSGVETRADVVALEGHGANAVLVGESLVASHDPAAKVRELLGTA